MWDEMELLDMRRAGRGDRPAPESIDSSMVDRWNEIQLSLRRQFPLAQVLAELSESRDALTEFLASVPDEMLVTGYIPMACMHSIRHDQRHAAEIRDRRRQRGL